jgi:hypothetical protein
VADWPAYSVDADICRLLADGPLSTTAIADRLGMPTRSARHRLLQLRRGGVVVVGADGLHHLADLAAPDRQTVADPATPDRADLAAPDRQTVADPATPDRADLAAPDRQTVADPATPDRADVAAPGLAVLAGSGSLPQGSRTDRVWESAIGVVAGVLIGLAVLILNRRPSIVPPASPIRYDPPVDPWWREW